ncbi:TIGR03089 family protein [Corynebacterium pacaense]|uniref:TIGR03089 family protein n=1 Tax=Corynebacterium pacaense TaxID=1816684 RepID=UPI0009B9B5E0|nr:TIGR03089 family protein [Corynebacterium pacaense]
MELLSHLLLADPATPRLTIYNETTGARLDFSALTLDNWAAKVGNMLLEELDLDEESTIAIDLPVSWQAAVIVLGALAAGIEVEFGDQEADAEFTTPDRFEANQPTGDVLLVSDDPFGRGIVESGGTLPGGTIDFGPTVRFYGDQFFNPTRALTEIVPPSGGAERVLSTGWSDKEGFVRTVLAPLAASGSAVIVAGLADSTRLDQIAAAEKVTARI